MNRIATHLTLIVSQFLLEVFMNNEAILLVPPTVIEVVSIVFNGARFSRWYLHLYHAALILVLMMSVQGEFEVDELPTCFGSFFHTVKLSWL